MSLAVWGAGKPSLDSLLGNPSLPLAPGKLYALSCVSNNHLPSLILPICSRTVSVWDKMYLSKYARGFCLDSLLENLAVVLAMQSRYNRNLLKQKLEPMSSLGLID